MISGDRLRIPSGLYNFNPLYLCPSSPQHAAVCPLHEHRLPLLGYFPHLLTSWSLEPGVCSSLCSPNVLCGVLFGWGHGTHSSRWTMSRSDMCSFHTGAIKNQCLTSPVLASSAMCPQRYSYKMEEAIWPASDFTWTKGKPLSCEATEIWGFILGLPHSLACPDNKRGVTAASLPLTPPAPPICVILCLPSLLRETATLKIYQWPHPYSARLLSCLMHLNSSFSLNLLLQYFKFN